MSKEQYFVRNAVGAYLRQRQQAEWTMSQGDATVFSTLADAEVARANGGDEPRSLWDGSGRQLVARQIGGQWFATPVRASS